MRGKRKYLVIPSGGAVGVEAASPFEAAKEARESYPDLQKKNVTVVATSLGWEFGADRWWK